MELDDLKQETRTETPPGFSGEELLRRYREKGDSVPEIPFLPEEAQRLASGDFENTAAVLRNLVEKGRAVGHPRNNVFSAIGQTQMTSYMRFAAQSISFFLDAARRTEKKTKELCAILGAPAPMTHGEISGLYGFCRLIGESKNLPQDWIVQKDLPLFSQELCELSELCEKNAGLSQDIFTSWKPEFAQIPAQQLLDRWDEALRKSALLRGRRISAVLKQAAPCCKISPEPQEVREALEKLAQYQKNDARITEISEKRRELLPSFRMPLPREELTALRAQALMLRSFCERVRESGCERYRANLTAENRSVLQSFYGTWRTFSEVQNGLYKNFRIDPEKLPVAGEYMESQISVCEMWLSNIEALPGWIAWNAAKAQAQESGLSKVVEAYEGGLLHVQVADAFEKGLCHALLLSLGEKG